MRPTARPSSRAARVSHPAAPPCRPPHLPSTAHPRPPPPLVSSPDSRGPPARSPQAPPARCVPTHHGSGEAVRGTLCPLGRLWTEAHVASLD